MKRADIELFERGLARSRSEARQLIEEGRVRVDGSPLRKASKQLGVDALIEVESRDVEFVSRAGYKMQAAMAHWHPPVAGGSLLDIGASTGGFTDCLLQAGVRSALCVDVGHGQLRAEIADDDRVTSLEGVNARHLDRSILDYNADQGFDVVSMDVSFISQTLILPVLPALMRPGACLLSLVKPQFELGPEALGKGGLVRDEGLRGEAIARVLSAMGPLHFSDVQWIDCPIAGSDGNREFLLYARYQPG